LSENKSGQVFPGLKGHSADGTKTGQGAKKEHGRDATGAIFLDTTVARLKSEEKGGEKNRAEITLQKTTLFPKREWDRRMPKREAGL